MKIYCTNLKKYVPFTGGETLLEIFERLKGEFAHGFTPICARVNNKTEDLHYPVFGPRQVEYLDSRSASGKRVYVRSLCMMLYKALANLYPGTRLRIEHSISGGYFCRLFKGQEATPEAVAALEAEMHRLAAADIPFKRHEKLTTDVKEIFRAQGLNDKVRLLDTTTDLYTVYYSLDGLSDSYYGNLAPATGAIATFALQPFKTGFLLLPPSAEEPEQVTVPYPQEKLYDAFTAHLRFNQILGVRNVGELNQAVEEKQSATLINVAEALHNKYVANIADTIAARFKDGGARIVLVAGPSSSGKTTFTKRLAIQLITNELTPQMISLDDYFVNRDRTPRDADGDYDFESLYALDLEQFNADLLALLRGEEIELPYYNFELGQRQYRGDKIRLTDRTVLLIEGIHGLNPELTAAVEERMKYRVYVSALTTLAIDDHNWVSTTDNRLLRRIIRDSRYRGVSPVETIRRWPSVRRGEEKWIFPFQENADSMFNSSLLFELSVMKEEADKLLKMVPRNVGEYATAVRLRAYLSYFTPVSMEALPPTSLLREFLGGSSFHY